jgi:tetratricopeptide (TPR) repeat protein
MRALVGIATTVYLGSLASAGETDAHSLVAEGNQAFAERDYVAAGEAYRRALLERPDSPELSYNLGVVHYKLGDYSSAQAAFGRALSTRDPELEARIKFNLGNIAYASALQEKSDPPKAIDFLRTAIRRYRDALELHPEDDDARVNLEIARTLLRDQLDEWQRQQKKRVQRQDGQLAQQEGEQDQQQIGPSGEQQPSAAEGPQEKRPQQADEGMTSEEGEQLLQAVRDRERQRCEQLSRRRRAQRTPAIKDW